MRKATVKTNTPSPAARAPRGAARVLLTAMLALAGAGALTSPAAAHPVQDDVPRGKPAAAVSPPDAQAARSTRVVFDNQTAGGMQRVQAELQHGCWTSLVPEYIPGHRAGQWESESCGMMTGTEGRASFSVPGGEVAVHWNNPYVGSNSYDCTAPSGYRCVKDSSTGGGNNATVRFRLSGGPAAAARSTTGASAPPAPSATAASAPAPAATVASVPVPSATVASAPAPSATIPSAPVRSAAVPPAAAPAAGPASALAGPPGAQAARSTHVTFNNHTDRLMLRTDARLAWGVWTANQYPPESIPPGNTRSWQSESEGFATGTEGEATYVLQGVGNVRIKWNNPYVGSNSYECSAPAGYQCRRSGGGGDNASPVFTLS
ncbi:Crystal protein ET79 [Streptomyces lavendulocolor]|uniref:Crystal protein ET79 n=1 Tax=Streptomyces lavendulocolor TaxID=67316 RepID=UPI0033C9CC4E